MNIRAAWPLAFAIALSACGSDEPAGTLAEPTAAAVADEPAAPAATDAPPTVAAPTTFKVGDVVNIGDTGATITLESIGRVGEDIAAVFVYDNTAGKEEQTVSSMLGFDIKDGNGNKAAATMLFEGAPAPSGLDGTVAVGDKLRGYVAWSGQGLSGPLKLYYAPSLFDAGNAIVWEVGEP